MENLKNTMHCINEAQVTVIAGHENEVKDLIVNLSLYHDIALELKYVMLKDLEETYFNGEGNRQTLCVNLKAIADEVENPSHVKSEWFKYSAVIADLLELAKTYDVKVVATLPTEKRSDCRSVYFYLPEDKKADVQIVLLENTGSEWRLSVECGANSWQYVAYDYDSVKGSFKEKIDGYLRT